MTTRPPIRRWLAFSLAGLVLAGHRDAPGQDVPPPASPTTLSDAQKADNVRSFDVIWETIRDTHYDAKLGGVDWQAARDELRPKVEAASTMVEARAAMNQAIGRLGLSHFGIVPSEVYKALENPAGGTGEIGLEVRVVDGRGVVTSVLEGSTAEKAGVGRGWVVEKVGGQATASIFEAAEKAGRDEGMKTALKSTGELVVDQYPTDYRKEDGVLMPHSVKQKVLGQQMVLRFEDFKHNVELAPDTFAVPPEIVKLQESKARPKAKMKAK